MKSESEEFCKNSFDMYLRKISPALSLGWTEVEQKAEPPEYYLSMNGVIYAVEVTILIQKVDVRAKNHLPVGVIRDLLKRFVDDEVEGVARRSGYLQGAYLVAFSKPVTNFANVKSVIQSELLSFIAATQLAIKAPARSLQVKRTIFGSPLFGLGIICAGVALVLIGKWFARNDVAWLSTAIQEAFAKEPPNNRLQSDAPLRGARLNRDVRWHVPTP